MSFPLVSITDLSFMTRRGAIAVSILALAGLLVVIGSLWRGRASPLPESGTKITSGLEPSVQPLTADGPVHRDAVPAATPESAPKQDDLPRIDRPTKTTYATTREERAGQAVANIFSKTFDDLRDELAQPPYDPAGSGADPDTARELRSINDEIRACKKFYETQRYQAYLEAAKHPAVVPSATSTKPLPPGTTGSPNPEYQHAMDSLISQAGGKANFDCIIASDIIENPPKTEVEFQERLRELNAKGPTLRNPSTTLCIWIRRADYPEVFAAQDKLTSLKKRQRELAASQTSGR